MAAEVTQGYGTLTDAFLADLDELSDESDDAMDAEVKDDVKDEDKHGISPLDNLAVTADDIKAIAGLIKTAKYQDTLRRVDAEVAQHGDAMPSNWAGPSEADPTYRLIVACNELAMAIDDEIAKVHAFIKDKYKKRFPELEGLVLDALTYARVVERIGNNVEDAVNVDLEDIVPRHVLMTISVSASTTDGMPLSQPELAAVLEATALAQRLETDRLKLLHFVGSRMALVAPNLSAVVGAEVAAKLVGAAGGLSKLSEIPACNIQVLGQKRRINAGLSSANVGANQGFVFGCPIVTNVPPDYRRKTGKLVANKVALLARFDAFGTGQRDGSEGARMKGEMQKTIEKWMEPPPAVLAKPLPRPDGEAKKRRGGRRWRKQKERAAATEMMKQAQRMEFGKAEEEYIDGDEMFGLGMLGKEGHGKLRVMQAASKIAKKEKLLAKAAFGNRKGGPGGLLSGTASSLALDQAQGIELENPDKGFATEATVGGGRSGTESYFSESSGFKTFRKVT